MFSAVFGLSRIVSILGIMNQPSHSQPWLLKLHLYLNVKQPFLTYNTIGLQVEGTCVKSYSKSKSQKLSSCRGQNWAYMIGRKKMGLSHRFTPSLTFVVYIVASARAFRV